MQDRSHRDFRKFDFLKSYHYRGWKTGSHAADSSFDREAAQPLRATLECRFVWRATTRAGARGACNRCRPDIQGAKFCAYSGSRSVEGRRCLRTELPPFKLPGVRGNCWKGSVRSTSRSVPHSNSCSVACSPAIVDEHLDEVRRCRRSK